jgi:O-antigen ligase
MTNPRQSDTFWHKLLAVASGIFLALCLLKFGNPVIFEEKISSPQDIFELIYSTWPLQWGYVAVLFLTVSALPVARWGKRKLAWVLIPLLIWFLWQFVSATHSVDSKLTSATLRHFSACVACFAVGYLCLSEVKNRAWVWLGLSIGFLFMLKAGFEQHFGGLEKTRKYFEMYVAPTLTNIPADYLKKIKSNRIFGTLFYPNSLAAAILLVLPVTTVFLWSKIRAPLRLVVIGLLIFGALLALYWSGSKTGWLLFIFMVSVAVIKSSLGVRARTLILSSLVVLGLTAFGLKYAGFFQKGATSVVARQDYWRAAMQTAKAFPLFGTGPGTFMIPYEKLKAPEAEMTRLCHNDYLQQASDSGLIGFTTYSLFVGASLLGLYRQLAGKNWPFSPEERERPLLFALWLGLVTFALHSMVEFHLYVAGLAWPFFLLLGTLCGGSNPIDNPEPTGKVSAR